MPILHINQNNNNISLVIYSRASHGTTPASQNMRKFISAQSRSVSLNSYAMFQPRAPNFLRSCTTPWNTHMPKRSVRHSWPSTGMVRQDKIVERLGGIEMSMKGFG